MLIDCVDPDCEDSPLCGIPAPAMSPRVLLVLIFVLALAGLYRIMRSASP
jgi:hypothetical protein